MKYTSIIYKVGVLYLLCPYFIFFTFWMKDKWKIFSLILITICMLKILFDDDLCINNVLHINKSTMVVGCAIIFVWLVFSGVGGFSYQNDDFVWRNAMFEIMVSENWPITMTIEQNGESVARGFSYYMGFWLPAAAFAKVFGIQIGNYIQFIWAFVGIILFFSLVWNYLESAKSWIIILFIFFSGFDYLGMIIYGTNVEQIDISMHLEWWATFFQYSSFTTQLYWVFNQAIPAWVATMLILEAKNNKYIVFILACAMLNCTMPFVGMIPIMLVIVIKNFVIKRGEYIDTKKWIMAQNKELFSVVNLFGGGYVGIMSYLFLKKKSVTGTISVFDMSHGGWSLLLVFLSLEVLVYIIFVFEKEKKNPLYYVIMLLLCVIPLIKLNDEGNFCMRASIPMLVILYVLTCDSIIYLFKEKNIKRLCAFLMCFCLGAVTPIHEMERSVLETRNGYINQENENDQEKIGIQKIMENDFESTDVDSNFFYKYIAGE